MGGGGDDTKNLILAAVLSMLVVFAWFSFFPPTPPPEQAPVQQAEQGAVPAPTAEEGGVAPSPVVNRDEALATDDRILIESPAVTGSIRLLGGRLDDLHLDRYDVTQDPEADTVVLLNPAGGPEPYYIDYGWRGIEGQDPGPLPKRDTPWAVETGSKLTPQTPVTLIWDNGAGLIFRRMISLDEQYMFTVAQSVENQSGAEVKLAPFGKIARYEGQSSTGLWILHEGAIAQTDEELNEIDYGDLEDIAPSPQNGSRLQHLPVTENGWLGFTDKYWMTALIPNPGASFDGYYQVFQRGPRPEFQALTRLPLVTAAVGATATAESRLFAGAKEYYTLKDYEADLGIKNFIDAIDWGWFYFLTKPIFQLLAWINGIIGNMGWSIIVLTLIIKSVLFPLAWKSYVSMSKMKKLQPEMEKIKERVGDDRQKMQQEMMALYKKEKVNPASGCLPILLQIPIFFSLYKVLFVTLEMRHAPFIGWITDLSAPDPTSIINLFGLLPWGVPEAGSIFAIFSIGVYPVLMGITMWLQQKLNPAPTDPTQQMIFAWMPWVFMFMLGTFASGLVIYWVANNTITFIQQYGIMRSQGVKVDILGNIVTSFKKRKPEAEKK
ncbi:MAG: membrane protein insertase YidC [Paracoccaceae bacterium]